MIPFVLTAKRSFSWVLVLTVSTGCAGAHFDITREIGLSPPRLEEEGDFYKAAKKRCELFDMGTPVLPECIRYHEALLWAGDYKSFMSARASLNKNIVYAGGVLALAGAGALLGLAAFGQTSSDAYKVLPIAGTFLGGLLGFSKNDSLYEAYQRAYAKMDQAIRRAQERAGAHSTPAYREAAELLHREVSGAVDELEQAKLSIVKFQAKSERDQFNDFQQAVDQGIVGGGVSVKSVTTDKPGSVDPTKIVVTLSEPINPTKLSVEQLRVKLVDVALKSAEGELLRVSQVDGAQLTADIPPGLQHHDPTTYLVQVQARHGAVTLHGAQSVDLNWSKRRLKVVVRGTGSISVQDPQGASLATCRENSPCERELKRNDTFTLSASSVTTWVWTEGSSIPTGCQNGQTPCPITLDRDREITVEFK